MELANSQISGGEEKAGVDSCFLGKWVCGSLRWKSLARRFKVKELPASRTMYRFGSGVARAVSTYQVRLQVGGVKRKVQIDVIRGGLPLLCGFDAQAEFGLIVDAHAKQVLQRGHDGVLRLLSTVAAGELPSITITPEQPEVKALPLWAKGKGVELECQSTAESNEESAGDSGGDSGEQEKDGIDEWGEWGGQEELAAHLAEAESEGSIGLCTDNNAEAQDEGKWTKVKKGWKQRKVEEKESLKKAKGNRYAALAASEAKAALAGEGIVLAGKKGMTQGKQTKTRMATQKVNDRKEELLKKPVERAKKAKKETMVEQFAHFEAWSRDNPEIKGTDDAGAEQGEVRLEGADAKDEGEGERMPKVLSTTRKELLKLHRGRHATPAVLVQFLRSTSSKQQQVKFELEFEQLEARVWEACNSCRGCQLSEQRISPGTTIPREPIKAYMQRVWLDLCCLDRSAGFWSLGIVEEATDEIALELCMGKGEEAVYDALFGRWLSLRGYCEVVVSDQGREFLGQKFGELLEAYGTAQGLSAAGVHEAHGRIERKFELLRHAETREVAGGKGPVTQREWRHFLYALENCARNTVTKRGFCSSQRAWGRGTSLLRSAWDDSPQTMQEPSSQDVRRLLEVQEAARDAFYQTVNSRKLRDVLAQKLRPDARIRQPGEEVWFRDSRQKWKGPGVVKFYDETQMRYEILSGAWTYRPGRYDVKGIEEQKITDQNPRMASREFAEKVGEAETKEPSEEEELEKAQTRGAELTRERREELLKATQRYKKLGEGKWEAEDGAVVKEVKKGQAEQKDGKAEVVSMATPVQSPVKDANAESDEEEKKGGNMRLPKRKKKKKAEENEVLCTVPMFWVNGKAYETAEDYCALELWDEKYEDFATRSSSAQLAAYVARTSLALVGVKAGADAYGETWEDVSVEEQKAARQRGIADYSEFGSWNPDEFQPIWELKQVDPGSLVFSAHWVDKAKRSEADGFTTLKGRSRWTPHGYEEWIAREITRSPTSAFQTHIVCEVVGRAEGWGGFRFDVSSAFFKSEEMEKVVHIRLPREEEERLGLPKIPGGYARRLLKEVPGTKCAPRAWWERIKGVLLRQDAGDEFWLEQSRVDPCLFWGRDAATGKGVGYCATHVDDGKGRGTDGFRAWLRIRLKDEFDEEGREGVKWVEGASEELFVGVEWVYEEECTYVHQDKYVTEELEEVPGTEKRKRQEVLDLSERAEAHRAIGQLRWVARTLPFWAQDIWECSRIPHDPESSIADLWKLNKLIREIKHHAGNREFWWRLPVLQVADLFLTSVTDAGEPPNDKFYNGAWREGQILLLGTALVGWHCSRATRVGGGSFGGECISCLGGSERAMGVQELVAEVDGLRPTYLEKILAKKLGNGEEWERKMPPAITAILDAEGVLKSVRINEGVVTVESKKRKHDIYALRELIRLGLLNPLGFIRGMQNPADPLTKPKALTKNTQPLLWNLIRGRGLDWDTVEFWGE